MASISSLRIYLSPEFPMFPHILYTSASLWHSSLFKVQLLYCAAHWLNDVNSFLATGNARSGHPADAILTSSCELL